MVDPLVSHVELEWSHPVSKRVANEALRHNTLVHFDLRGSGLSDRRLATTLDDFLLDVEAVTDRLELDEFALSGVQMAAPVAIAFAARHPECVRKLVVIDGYARSRSRRRSPKCGTSASSCRRPTSSYAAHGLVVEDAVADSQ
jgi:pimeloyl-ACP methyl ester carboxylesterase